jgi:hypothetical protein
MKGLASLILRLALMLALMLCLIGCRAVPYNAAPPYPIAGPKVAEELRKHCFPKTGDTGETINLCPATAEWLARIDKLKDQIGTSNGR